MEEIILIKGKHEVITSPEFGKKAEKLYSFLTNYFKKKGFFVKSMETNEEINFEKILHEKTLFLVGHSLGGDIIIEHFDAKKYPQIKGIIIFDPMPKNSFKWNRIATKKLALTGSWSFDNHGDYEDRVILEGDHYFSNCSKEIEEILEKKMAQFS